MKLWEKNFEINKEIERFTVGRDREMDMYLAKYDVLGSMAHITMLESIGLLEKDELTQLLAELKNIYRSCERGEFVIEDDVEDVHSQVEMLLTRKLGDMGKKIHSGRSRNDQVLVDLKLFTRHQLKDIADEVKILFDELIAKSQQYKNILMPGYTHLQVAMPSSFGLWFGAYAESLADDLLFLQAAYRMTNRNPLGSAAGYGSSFPLNRTMTTELLGFDSMDYNVVYAQMGRGKIERNVGFAIASIAGTLAKMAFDACMFNSQNFSFVKLPKECLYDLTTWQLLSIDGWKEKSAKRFLDSLRESISVPFERVLFALGIRYVGEQTAKEIARHFGNIDAIAAASLEELAQVKDVGDVIAQSIFDYMADARHSIEIQRLRAHGIRFSVEQQLGRLSDTLEGQTVVVSGNFSISRDSLKELVERHGGKCSGSVSSKTSFLLAGSKPGPEKIKKCQELGIRIVSEDEFWGLLPEDSRIDRSAETEPTLF